MKLKAPRFLSAFTLVEVTLSLGIAAFCMVNLLGLIPVGVASQKTSAEQTGAAWIATSIVEDLRTTPKAYPPSDQTSPQFHFNVPATSSGTETLFLSQDGRTAGALNTNADPAQNPRYRATLYFTGSGSSATGQRAATSVRILITWPALADGAAGNAPSNYSGSYEAWISLDRS